MIEDLPAPLVPGDVCLRGMPFLPLYGDRMFKSTTWIGASNDAKVAAIRLYWHSFVHETPAASLPDNDQLLAEHAGFGSAIRSWKRVKAQAMNGWIKCNDSRWYHPVVAEFALDAWAGRVRNREKVRKFRDKRAASNPGVTVTEPVTKPARNGREGQQESEGQQEGQLQGQVDAADGGGGPAAALQAYQDAARLHGWPAAGLLTQERRDAIEARLAECDGLEGWKIALEKAHDADYLRHSSGVMQGWFDLDWILKARNFARLLEGRYDRIHEKPRSNSSLAAAIAGIDSADDFPFIDADSYPKAGV